MAKNKYMRLIIMYDLPMSTVDETREYSKFHKHIQKRGFVIIQNSIYMKVINATTKVEYEIKGLYSCLPTNGNIRVLKVTEKQYHNMVYLRGKQRLHEETHNAERYVRITDET